MTVEDRIDLVGALRRLVDALRIQRDHPRRRLEHLEEGRDIDLVKPGCPGCRNHAAGDGPSPRQRLVKARGVFGDVGLIQRAVVGEIDEQPAEQRGIGAGLQTKKQIVIADRIGAARIDHDDACAPCLLVGQHALIQHRVAPGGIGADQHQQIRLIEILVAPRHRIGAKRTLVAGHGRGHAEPRIGIDIGAAEKALHQLVGDVVILRQQLAGEIKGHGTGAMFGDGLAKTFRDMIQRIAPGGLHHFAIVAAHHRMQQALVEAQRFAERRSFRTKPAEIGGMRGITRNRCATVGVRRCQHTATDTAVRTCGARGMQMRIDRVHHAASARMASARPNMMSARISATP